MDRGTLPKTIIRSISLLTNIIRELQMQDGYFRE